MIRSLQHLVWALDALRRKMGGGMAGDREPRQPKPTPLAGDAVVTVRSVEVRRPGGSVLLQWFAPSNEPIYVEDLFRPQSERIIGAAQAWLSEQGGGGDWQLLATQDEQGGVHINFLPGVATPWRRPAIWE